MSVESAIEDIFMVNGVRKDAGFALQKLKTNWTMGDLCWIKGILIIWNEIPHCSSLQF